MHISRTTASSLLGFRASKGILYSNCSSSLDNWKIVSGSAVQGGGRKKTEKGGGVHILCFGYVLIYQTRYEISSYLSFLFSHYHLEYNMGALDIYIGRIPVFVDFLLFSYFPTFHWGFNNIDFNIHCLLLNITSCVILRV